MYRSYFLSDCLAEASADWVKCQLNDIYAFILTMWVVIVIPIDILFRDCPADRMHTKDWYQTYVTCNRGYYWNDC